jgi:acyl-coenzyme A thioesterase PaaI-like protein
MAYPDPAVAPAGGRVACDADSHKMGIRMDLLELPHTAGCLVCGRDNPHGLKLSFHVEPGSGVVHAEFVPRPEHIGFEGVVHGGVVATVLDEAMVWTASWSVRRFCFCGELMIRFKKPVSVGEHLIIESRVVFSRPKLIQTLVTARSPNGAIVAAGEGKYVPMAPEQSDRMMRSLVENVQTQAAAAFLTRSSATPVVPVPASAGPDPQRPSVSVTIHPVSKQQDQSNA